MKKAMAAPISVPFLCSLLLLALSLLLPATGRAETVKFVAVLTPAGAVPPAGSAGSGNGEFSYDTDTKQLTYIVVHQGLSGSATAGHIHGPARSGTNGEIVVPFPFPESPIGGTSTLSDEQAAALLAGLLYVDIHTAAHPSGELGGRITR